MEYGAIHKELVAKSWRYLQVNAPLEYQKDRQAWDPPVQTTMVEMEMVAEIEMHQRQRNATLLQPFGEPGHIGRCPRSGESVAEFMHHLRPDALA